MNHFRKFIMVYNHPKFIDYGKKNDCYNAR